jgi:hypothetical protein
VRPPEASHRAPVEHLYREVVCVPEIFDHTVDRNLPKRLCSRRLSTRNVPVTRFPVPQQRFRLDPDSASI